MPGCALGIEIEVTKVYCFPLLFPGSSLFLHQASGFEFQDLHLILGSSAVASYA